MHETIQALFNAPNAVVVSADVNEIGVQEDSPLTQFTAAMLATNVLAAHIQARSKGLWKAIAERRPAERPPAQNRSFSEHQ